MDDFSFREPRRHSAAEAKFDKVITYRPEGGECVELGYMTIHKSKGLQADNVIVIGLVNDRYGFPNTVADNAILELLLADSDRYEHAEERRLLYVALTRTKNRVWLVMGDDTGHPGMSAFVNELRRDNENGSSFVFYSREASDPSARCPCCGGVLLRRTSGRDGREFYGCTNWPTYCSYTMNLDGTGDGQGWVREYTGRSQKSSAPHAGISIEYGRRQPGKSRGAQPRCPRCGARMAIKSGPYGQFYGCSCFPSCRGTRNYPA